MGGRWRWAAGAVVLAALAAAVVWAGCRRRAVPVLKAGGYVMHVAGEESEVAFREDGYFMRRAGGKWWRGKWRQEGATLFVEELKVGGEGPRWVKWTAALSSPAEGTLDDGTPFRLEVRGREP